MGWGAGQAAGTRPPNHPPNRTPCHHSAAASGTSTRAAPWHRAVAYAQAWPGDDVRLRTWLAARPERHARHTKTDEGGAQPQRGWVEEARLAGSVAEMTASWERGQDESSPCRQWSRGVALQCALSTARAARTRAWGDTRRAPSTQPAGRGHAAPALHVRGAPCSARSSSRERQGASGRRPTPRHGWFARRVARAAAVPQKKKGERGQALCLDKDWPPPKSLCASSPAVLPSRARTGAPPTSSTYTAAAHTRTRARTGQQTDKKQGWERRGGSHPGPPSN